LKEDTMLKRPFLAIVAGAALLLGACSSGGASTAPSAAASAAASVEASAPAAGGGAPCAESATAGEVSVSIKGFAFNPADITAKVGQTITFTNDDSAPHTATLDDGSCTTPQIAGGASDGLTFTAAGTFPFHCNVHPNMKGTITVS
jgi:plastocyanin